MKNKYSIVSHYRLVKVGVAFWIKYLPFSYTIIIRLHIILIIVKHIHKMSFESLLNDLITFRFLVTVQIHIHHIEKRKSSI